MNISLNSLPKIPHVEFQYPKDKILDWLRSLAFSHQDLGYILSTTDCHLELYQAGSRGMVFWFSDYPLCLVVASHERWNHLIEREVINASRSPFSSHLPKIFLNGNHSHNGINLSYYVSKKICRPSIYSINGSVYSYIYGLQTRLDDSTHGELFRALIVLLLDLFDSTAKEGVASVRFDSWDFLMSQTSPMELACTCIRSTIRISFDDYKCLLIDEFSSPGDTSKIVNHKMSVFSDRGALKRIVDEY